MKKLLFYASAVAVLFSSCSKDATEDVNTVASGNNIFTASIGAEEQTTRLHLGGDKGTSYIWDVADGIGIASDYDLAANVPSYTTEQTNKPAFSVSAEDYRYLFEDVAVIGKPLYAYFPYAPGVEFYKKGQDKATKNNVYVEMSIPAVQRYAENSFYKNTVNAVGYVSEFAEGAQIDLKIPSSLLSFEVIGLGNTDEDGITLRIKDADGNYYTLNGTSEVEVTAEEPTLAFAENAKQQQVKVAENPEVQDPEVQEVDPTAITVTFGSAAEKFDYYKPITVFFVVPAGLDLKGATLEFTNGEDTFEKTLAAGPVTKANLWVGFKSWTVDFGLDGKFLVADDENLTAEEKFLAYAYLVRPGVANPEQFTEALIADYAFAAKHLGVNLTGEDGVLGTQAWIIDSELDFAAYDKAWAIAQYNAMDDALSHLDASPVNDEIRAKYRFWMNVYRWYANGDAEYAAIESLSYNGVVGAQYNNPYTTIKNITVKGNGISAGASLKNLSFEAVTVVSETAKANVGLIAGNNNMSSEVYGGKPAKMVIENVTISADNVVKATNAAYVGGIYGQYTVNKNDILAAAAIKIEAEGTTKATGRLYGYVTKSLNLELGINYAWDDSVLAYPVIGSQNGGIIVANQVIDATKLNAFVVGNSKKGSIIVDGVSYWNGYVDTKITDDEYFTAEELAKVLANGHTSGASVTFQNNINMQGNFTTGEGEEVAPMFTLLVNGAFDNKATVKGEGFTLSNTNVAVEGWGVLALFGADANIENLTVEGLNVDAVAETTGAVAGLAITGTAKDVTVKNVNINVTGKAWHDKYDGKTNGIAAVFANADTTDLDTVTVSGCTINSSVAATAGVVAGVLNITGKVSEVNGIVVEGKNKVTIADTKSMTLNGTAKVNTSYIVGTAYAFNAPFGVANVKDAAFSEAGQVDHDLTVTNCSYGDKFAAGYWVKPLGGAKDVTLSETALKGYGYVFNSNANAGTSARYNHIGFMPKN